jgi:hypothetical protein
MEKPVRQAHGTLSSPPIVAHSDRLLSREKCIARGYKMSGSQSRSTPGLSVNAIAIFISLAHDLSFRLFAMAQLVKGCGNAGQQPPLRLE